MSRGSLYEKTRDQTEVQDICMRNSESERTSSFEVKQSIFECECEARALREISITEANALKWKKDKQLNG